VPWRPWDNPFWQFNTGGPVHPSKSFFGVDDALGLPALYAGAKLLADGVASLPLRQYTQYSGGGGFMKHRPYDGPSIFDKPSINGTTYDWMFTGMNALILQGNAWGFVTGRDGYGFPTGIEWVPPEDVVVQEPSERQSFNPLDARVYVYGKEINWRTELFHLRAFPMPGRIQGISLLRAFALTLTAGKQAMQYGTDWYASGGFPPGTFQNAEIEIDADQANLIRSQLVSSLRRREPLVYGRDWDYKPITVPPSEAQFIDAIQLNATQIAAILNLPPDRIGGSKGDSLTYSTAEQSTLQIIEALRPWLVKLEQAFSELIPRNRFVKFYTDALLKTDLESRMNIYQVQRNIGIRTADEIRELEDLPPLPGGIGAETMPLTLMNALGTRAGAIPKSILKSVVLEMDIATDRLIKLEKTQISQGKLPQATAPAPGQGGFPPKGNSNGSSPVNGNALKGSTASGGALPAAGNTVTDTNPAIGKPNAPLPLAQDPASFLASLISVQRDNSQPFEARQAARELYVSILERAHRIEQIDGNDAVPGTDAIAPWMHSPREVIESGK
jgi:HK97 family phage portal protein